MSVGVGREDVLGEIKKTTNGLDRSAREEISASVFEKAKRYAESCTKCNFKMSFTYDLLETNEVEYAVTPEQAKEVVEGCQGACKILLRYATNLLNHPHKIELRRIKLSSNFYLYRVSNKLLGAERVLIHMGYKPTGDSQDLVYDGDVNKEAIVETIADLVVLHTMLDLYLKWLNKAWEHGSQARLKEIIDYCKAGFAHVQILTLLTKPSFEAMGNRQEGNCSMQAPLQRLMRNTTQEDGCKDRTGESKNASEAVISTVTGGKLQGMGDPRVPPLMKQGGHQIVRQTSCPGEEAHSFVQSPLLEGVLNSSKESSQLERDLSTVVVCKPLSAMTANTVETSEVLSKETVNPTLPPNELGLRIAANAVRSPPLVSRWECSYCLFLNPFDKNFCEVCNKKEC